MKLAGILGGMLLLGCSSLAFATPCSVSANDGGIDCGEFVDSFDGNDQGSGGNSISDQDFLDFLANNGFTTDDVIEFMNAETDGQGEINMGTWDAGQAIQYLIIKAGNGFRMFNVGGASSGMFATCFIGEDGPCKAYSHISRIGGGVQVPEPSALALLGLGLGMFGFTARRRRKI